MRQQLFFSTIICLPLMLYSVLGYGANKSSLVSFDRLPLNQTQKSRVLAQKIVINSEVETVKNGQKQVFDFYIAGKHKRSCRFAVKKLKRYEQFHQFIEIVKSSKYDYRSKDLNLLIEPPVIPGKLRLNFKIERINGVGVYPFTFDKGFLNGLRGEIHISEHKHRCLFYIWSKWNGPKTQYSDRVLELFSSTVGRMVMEKLFRISTTL